MNIENVGAGSTLFQVFNQYRRGVCFIPNSTAVSLIKKVVSMIFIFLLEYVDIEALPISS